jgi:membrane-bound lytic murein transglycosylase MltF
MSARRWLMIAAVGAVALTPACGRNDQAQRAGADRAAQTASEGEASQPNQTAAGSGAPDAPNDEVIAKVLVPWHGDLDEIVTRGYVRVLVTFSKTNYFLDKGDQRGISYEAGKLFEQFLNKRSKPKKPVHVVFIPMRRDRLFPALAEGRGDIAAAGLAVTPDAEKMATFARPFVTDATDVVVTAAGEPPLDSAAGLSGREVHVRRSSSYYDHLTEFNRALMREGKAPVTIVEASENLEDEDILEMVNAELIPATVVHGHVARFWSQVFDKIRVNEHAPVHERGSIAWAVRKDAPKLRDTVDAFAKANGPGTLMFNVLTKRYLQTTDWVKNNTSEAELRRFRAAIQFFRRYAGQYDFPWLLVAAQAYQESQIDQSRKSHAGAVGVMQIKPETAAGPPVSIKGVDRSMENNIHAGVKYLRFIADRYYKDAPMDRINKGLFTMASYNAGPARITGLRKKAERMGLNPNLWFGNVEVVAAREIGRETVQYVSNIYKYYVAYTLVVQQMEQREAARGAKQPR